MHFFPLYSGGTEATSDPVTGARGGHVGARKRNMAARVIGSLALGLTLAALVSGGEPAVRGQSSGSFMPSVTFPGVPNIQPADAWRQLGGLVVDRDGTLFAADADRESPRVTARHTDGGVEVLATGSADCAPAMPGSVPGLCEPGYLALDPGRDRLYVADRLRHGVFVFDRKGSVLGFLDGVPAASGLAVDSGGTLFAASAVDGRLYRFDPTGRPLGHWDVFPPKPGGGNITGVAIDWENRLYVADGRSTLIRVLTPGGLVAQEIGENWPPLKILGLAVGPMPGTSQRQFYLATNRGLEVYNNKMAEPAVNGVGPLGSVTIDAARDQLLAGTLDFGSGFSQVLSWQLRFAAVTAPARFGRLPIPLGAHLGPFRMALSEDAASVLVADRSERLQTLTVDGAGETQAAAPVLEDIAPFGGRVLGLVGDRLLELERDPPRWTYTIQREWPLQEAGAPPAYGVALGMSAAGEVSLLDLARRQVRRFGQDGRELPALPLGGTTRHWADLTVDPGGRVVVLDASSGEIFVAEPGGPVPLADIDRPALRLQAGADGRIFVLDDAGWVWGVRADGAVLGAYPVTRLDLSPASRPADLLALPDGDLLVADRGASVITRFRWDPAATAPEPPLPDESHCRIDLSKVASPTALLLGEIVNMQLGARGSCSYRQILPVDLYFVIDISGSMAGERIASFRQAVLDFSIWLNWSHSRVGLVSFNQSARVLVPLTIEEAGLRQALGDLRPFGSSRIDRGLSEVGTALAAQGRPGTRQVVVLVSDGRSGRTEAVAAADRLKAQGITVFTVATEDAQQPLQLMEELASSASHALVADDPQHLAKLLSQIADRLALRELFQSVTLVDEIPTNMGFVPGSDRPPAVWNPTARSLTWQFANVTDAGMVVEYQLEPQSVGDWPTNRAAWLDYIDGFARPGRVDFPVPRVRVGLPTAIPTATATATATPRPRPIFLPLLLRESCVVTERSTDVILVLDSSRSMDGPKLEASQAAAEVFIDQLRLPRDRVALVTFDSSARLLSPLTGDAAALRSAVRALRTQPGTRIDLGLDMAQSEVNSSRHRPGATRTIVLLTDGVQEDRARVLGIGRRICGEGIQLYTIGLGPPTDVDNVTLQALACRPDMFFQAATPELLAGIYTAIAGDIPCDRTSFWGRR